MRGDTARAAVRRFGEKGGLVVLVIAFGSLFAVSWILLGQYRERLPVAPSCPSCRAVTSGVAGGELLTYIFPSFAATVLRECTRCGWSGRMRWRVAPKTVRRDEG